jgi:hypothetical protein
MNKMVKSLLIMAVLMLGLNRPAHAVLIAEDHPALKVCDSAQTVGLILSQYPNLSIFNSIQALPFPPFVGPGIEFGLSSRTSVIIVMCGLLHDIAAGDTQNAIFATGRALNDLTDNKWSHHLDMADQTWNLANTMYDFESGEMRKGTLSSASTHREINDYMKTSYGWFNKTFNGTDAQLKNRGEREQEMNQLSALAMRRSILTEAQNCPDPSQAGGPNFEKIYKTEIKPAEIARDEANNDIEFIRNKLAEMGPKFVNDERELNKYLAGIERMMSQGISYKVSYKQKSDTKQKPHPTKKDKEGKPVMTEVKLKTQTQEWTTQSFTEIFNDFKKDWGSQWSSWVTAQYVQSSRGLLTNGRQRVEAEFMDMNYECSMGKLMRGVDVNRPDYDKLSEERYQKCITETQMNQKKAENLLEYYATQLQASLKKLKDANAKIWTTESWHLGTMRSVNTKDKTEGYQQEQVACADGNKLTPAEMEKIGLKQQSVNTELKELITKQQTKKTSLMEMEAKANADQLEEIKKRQSFSEQQGKRASDSLKENISPVPVQGGI